VDVVLVRVDAVEHKLTFGLVDETPRRRKRKF
jgi:hypothetical protein